MCLFILGAIIGYILAIISVVIIDAISGRWDRG